MASFMPPRSCRPANPPGLLADTIAEVSSWIRQLRVAGWTMTRIAVAIECSEDSLRDWRDGKTSMPVVRWKALRALAAEFGKQRRVG